MGKSSMWWEGGMVVTVDVPERRLLFSIPERQCQGKARRGSWRDCHSLSPQREAPLRERSTTSPPTCPHRPTTPPPLQCHHHLTSFCFRSLCCLTKSVQCRRETGDGDRTGSDRGGMLLPQSVHDDIRREAGRGGVQGGVEV